MAEDKNIPVNTPGIKNTSDSEQAGRPAGSSALTVMADGEGDETAFMKLDADTRTQLSVFAKFLSVRIADANEAILLDVDYDRIHRVGMCDPSNGARLGNIAHALRISTQEIKAVPLSKTQFLHLKAISYGQIPKTTGQLNGGGATVWERFAAADVTAEDQELQVAEYNTASFERAPTNMRDYATWLLGRAASLGASDVHLEPGVEVGRIRFRMDGVLQTVEANIPARRYADLIRVLAAMAPSVRSDRIKLETFSATIPLKIHNGSGPVNRTEFRAEFVPTKSGQAVTIRQNARPLTDITRIGFEQEQLAHIYNALQNPTGIILVTGPTGSGKSNTLEAALAILERGDERKLIQIGNPVEFVFPGRVQMSISDFLSWDDAFKSSLRQDPDIISPGECRDRNEAKLVLNAALTGHLVLTSFHTSDVASTFTRLEQMGISPDNQADAINLIIAQRLVRVLCAECKQEDATRMLRANARPFKKVGCDRCGNAGYRGRTAIAEVLFVTPELRDLIRRQSRGTVAGAQIVDYARKHLGMLTLTDVAYRKVRAGITSISEAERVIYLAADDSKSGRDANQHSSPPDQTRFAYPAEMRDTAQQARNVV